MVGNSMDDREMLARMGEPTPVLGICDGAIKPSYLHKKESYCRNWRPGQVITGDVKPLIKPEKPRHAVGVSVLLIENGKLLLGKRGPGVAAGQGWWGTPGGRLELDEDFESCARREFKEETGSTLNGPLKVIGYKKHFRFEEHYIMFYVFASSHMGFINNPEPTKCEGWQWIDQEGLFFFDLQVTEPKDILHTAFAEWERNK